MPRHIRLRPATFAALFVLALAGTLLTGLPSSAFAQDLPPAGDIDTSLLFHSASPDAPTATLVPGETFPFIQLPPAGSHAPVRIHVLTSTDFAGPLDEQVYVRWWDGRMAHWIMGYWVRNLPAEVFSGAIPAGSRVDLWRVEIPDYVWQSGQQFYAIQVKGYQNGTSVDRYLLGRSGGDFTHTNSLGQIWSASEEFEGQDWAVTLP